MFFGFRQIEGEATRRGIKRESTIKVYWVLNGLFFSPQGRQQVMHMFLVPELPVQPV